MFPTRFGELLEPPSKKDVLVRGPPVDVVESALNDNYNAWDDEGVSTKFDFLSFYGFTRRSSKVILNFD